MLKGCKLLKGKVRLQFQRQGGRSGILAVLGIGTSRLELAAAVEVLEVDLVPGLEGQGVMGVQVRVSGVGLGMEAEVEKG